jgi:hypothetical protein
MSRKLRIALVGLAALLASAACLDGVARAAPRDKPERQDGPAAASTSAAPSEAAAQPSADLAAPAPAAMGRQQSESAATPSAPVSDERQQAVAPAPEGASPASGEGGVEQSTAASAGPRFKVEAVGFRAVDESGPNYPDSDIVFAVFESQQYSVTTRVFEDVDTGDARAFDPAESCIYPARDADGLRNGAWECSGDGADGPIAFAVGIYEIDPDFVGDYRQDFCAPPAAADVETAQRNCDTDHSDLLFRTAFSYQSADILARLDAACRCINETVRYRESNERGVVEYHLTFRITRTDAGGAPPAADHGAERVYRRGARSAALGQGFELDGGVSAALGPDLAFSGAPAAMMLAPTGGAKIWPGDANARGYAACSAERGSANYVATAVAAPAVGQYACYLTNNGRVGELRVDNLTTSFSTAVLSVSYTTWR